MIATAVIIGCYFITIALREIADILKQIKDRL